MHKRIWSILKFLDLHWYISHKKKVFNRSRIVINMNFAMIHMDILDTFKNTIKIKQ